MKEKIQEKSPEKVENITLEIPQPTNWTFQKKFQPYIHKKRIIN